MSRPDVPIPHQFRPSSLLGAVPGLADQFKTVPEGFFELGETAQITCPCEWASFYVPPAKLTGCGNCGRVYLLTKSGLRCAQGMSDQEWDEYQAEAA